MRKPTVLIGLMLLLALTAGCRQQPGTSAPEEPTTGVQPPAEGGLYSEVRGSGYEAWATAPGYESKQKAQGPHGDEVQIRLSPDAEEALDQGAAEWPIGALIIKDIYREGDLDQIAAMKKTDEGWYWGEWDSQGEPIAEGLAIDACEGCHSEGTDGTLAISLE